MICYENIMEFESLFNQRKFVCFLNFNLISIPCARCMMQSRNWDLVNGHYIVNNKSFHNLVRVDGGGLSFLYEKDRWSVRKQMPPRKLLDKGSFVSLRFPTHLETLFAWVSQFATLLYLIWISTPVSCCLVEPVT
jgi:hypothetical protein